MITVTLPVQLEQHFLHIAEESKQPANQVIQQALAEFAEDYLDARMGEAAIERLQRGESEIISLEDVERMLDEMDD